MDKVSIVKDCLFAYVDIILKFEKELTDKYNLDDNPYQRQNSFPRRAILESGDGVFDYHFHGGGCSFEHKGFEVHYDYYITLKNYISISPWKFWRFVTTYLEKNKKPEISIEEIAEILEELDKTGVIQKTQPGYLVYQVSFLWYVAYEPAS